VSSLQRCVLKGLIQSVELVNDEGSEILDFQERRIIHREFMLMTIIGYVWVSDYNKVFLF
jgi:hypothetical protein